MLALVHAAATLFMTGVIWFTQLVHYPMLRRAKDDPAYFVENARRTALLVLPVMLLEAASAALLLVSSAGLERLAAWGGLFLLGIIWGVTAFHQYPAHAALGRAWDEPVFRSLLRVNRARVALWSLRSLLALSFLAVR